MQQRQIGIEQLPGLVSYLLERIEELEKEVKFKGEQTEVLRRKLSKVEKRLEVQSVTVGQESLERRGSGGVTGEEQKVENTQLPKQRDTRDKKELIGRPIVIRGSWRGTVKANNPVSRVYNRQDGKNPVEKAKRDSSLAKE